MVVICPGISNRSAASAASRSPIVIAMAAVYLSTWVLASLEHGRLVASRVPAFWIFAVESSGSFPRTDAPLPTKNSILVYLFFCCFITQLY